MRIKGFSFGEGPFRCARCSSQNRYEIDLQPDGSSFGIVISLGC